MHDPSASGARALSRRALLRLASRGGLLAALLSACSTAPEESAPPPLPRPYKVLILGDSISMAYTPFVREALAGRAEVHRPRTADGTRDENCEGTRRGLERLDTWLSAEGGGWDVIHFNFGLHDLKRVDPETGRNSQDLTHPHQSDPEHYELQLRTIAERLRATGARLVFATTTPVPESVGGPRRLPSDAIEYNRRALKVVRELDLPCNDLYAFVLPRLAELQQPKDVHFTEAGSRALAEQVVRAIRAVAGDTEDAR